jgi:hypothetical protein
MSQVRCSHLLVKHQGSRRPASWKDANGDRIKLRTKQQAIDTLSQFRQQIVAGANFAELVPFPLLSDCSILINATMLLVSSLFCLPFIFRCRCGSGRGCRFRI